MSDSTPEYSPPPPPAGLVKLNAEGKPSATGRKDGAGRRYWKAITADGKYILRADELCQLEEACELKDRAEELKLALDGRGLTARGSTGQTVADPLRQEERMLRGQISQILSRIKLPEDAAGEGAAAPRSVGARTAAKARWGTA